MDSPVSRTTTAPSRVWDGLRELVEERLPEYVRPKLDESGRLNEAIAYSLLSGGKRLRPILVLLASDACGGDREQALPAACAIEMVHTYSLVHDDLPAMDDDDLRRGRPTCHNQFDEATAILVGDALLTRAFEVLATEVSPPEVATACCADLASAAGSQGMVGGQQADLEAERADVECDATDALERLESIHRRKTGRLITSALTMGGRIAGATSKQLECLENYGSRVGLAFQIADDLLDVTGTREKMGKNVRKDAEIGKLTYPSLLGEAESRRRAADLVAAARESLEPFGERAHGLDELARFVLERDH